MMGLVRLEEKLTDWAWYVPFFGALPTLPLPPPPLPVPRLGSIVAVPASRLGEMMGYFGVGHGHSTPSYILIGPPSLFALPALEKKCLGN